jgi:hypothetical protein
MKCAGSHQLLWSHVACLLGLFKPDVWDFFGSGVNLTHDTHRLSPLSAYIIGFQDVLAPETISALDKAENPQGVDIIAQWDTESLHEGLGGLDMGPSRVRRNKVGKQYLPTEVVDGDDQGPFALREWGPQKSCSPTP